MRVSLLFGAFGMMCSLLMALGVWSMVAANTRARHIYEQLTLPSQYRDNSYRLQLLTALAVSDAIANSDSNARKRIRAPRLAGQFRVAVPLRQNFFCERCRLVPPRQTTLARPRRTFCCHAMNARRCVSSLAGYRRRGARGHGANQHQRGRLISLVFSTDQFELEVKHVCALRCCRVRR